MSNLTKFNSSTIMMSSREIAELCDKRHDHVMRDIRNMFEVEEHSPNLGFVYKTSTYKADNGQEYTQYELDRDEEQFFVAKAAAKLYGYNNISNQVAQKLGMALSRLSREMGYEIQKRKHCDFTEVGAYHIDVIRELFEIRGYEIYQ